MGNYISLSKYEENKQMYSTFILNDKDIELGSQASNPWIVT